MLLPVLAALALPTVLGPDDDHGPARACPFGDAPAAVAQTHELGALEHVGRTLTLRVEDGVGHLTIEERVVNRTPGPARIAVHVDGAGAVTGAWITDERGGRRAAVLGDRTDAAVSFGDFENALALGVSEEEVQRGEARGALLVEHATPGTVEWSVASACSVREMTVTLEAIIPSAPVDGGWRFDVPLGVARGQDSLTVSSSVPARVRIDGAGARRDDAVSLEVASEDADTSPRSTVVEVTPVSGPRLRVRGASTAVGDVVVARAELDLPRHLTTPPAGLRLVFVVDASVSVGGAALAKELQVVRGILDEAPPDARWAMVAAGRRPRVVAAPWQAVDEESLAPLDLENGSDVGAAVKLAAAIASDVEPGEVGRVIVLSDMQLKFADGERWFPGASASAPLTHAVVMPEDGDVEMPMTWARMSVDDDPRARAAEVTGGIWVDASGGDDDEEELFEHLIHPTRLDWPRVIVAGRDVWAEAASGDARFELNLPEDSAMVLMDRVPRFLEEGDGLRVDARLPGSAAGAVRVTGSLWARPFDEAAGPMRDAMALVAAGPLADEMDDEPLRALAGGARVVSRVTSLLALPAWRPASDVVGGWGCSACCCSCGSRCGGVGYGIGTAAAHIDELSFLQRLLAEDAAACGVSRAEVEVEFGDREILDVKGLTGGACVVDRAWRRRLDRLAPAGSFRGHRRITVEAEAGAAR